jgi:hypothetical protein
MIPEFVPYYCVELTNQIMGMFLGNEISCYGLQPSMLIQSNKYLLNV